MFEYIYNLFQKFLSLFKNSSESPSEVSLLILKNKKYLRNIININEDYTRDELIELLNNIIYSIDIDMSRSDEIKEITFEDIEKRTLLLDIINLLKKI
jgi:hypothetical protein